MICCMKKYAKQQGKFPDIVISGFRRVNEKGKSPLMKMGIR